MIILHQKRYCFSIPVCINLKDVEKRFPLSNGLYIISCRGFCSFVLHEILQVEETTVKEMDNWKAIPRDNEILKINNGAPIQDG